MLLGVCTDLLAKYGLRKSLKKIREYVEQLGCDWSSDQVSRIDLRADLRQSFEEFQWRIDAECFVTRMRPGPPND